MKKNLLISIWMTLATTVLLGIVYPLVGDFAGAMGFSAAGEWRNHSDWRQIGGIEPDRAAVYFGGIFSFAAIGRGSCWIRSGCGEWRRDKLWADEFGAYYASEFRCAAFAGGKSRRANSRGSGDEFGIGAGSASFAGCGGISNSARGARAGDERGGSSRFGGAAYGRAAVGIFGRAAGECVGIEFGIGCAASVALGVRGFSGVAVRQPALAKRSQG